jgi:glucosamine--fructose-6-phosphate aminotransferase (isomerizing)
MCGIFGMYSSVPLSETHRSTFVSVAQSQVVRGHHAFGIAWSTDSGSVDSFKRVGSVVEHSRELHRCLGSKMVIGHTRWATHGDATNNLNNHPHPFAVPSGRGYLVHNGIVSNYQEIADSRGLSMISDCDSEVLARHIEDNNGDILSRVRDAVSDVDPYAPLAVAVLVPEGLVLARRGNPLYWSDTRNFAWFASTQTALVGKVYEVPDNTAFLIPSGSGKVSQVPLRRREASMRRWVGSDLFA